MLLPDINALLKELNGKVGPLGLFKVLRKKKYVKGLRGLLFGIKEKYRSMGIPLVAIDYLKRLFVPSKYEYIEVGWNLEDNDFINLPYIEAGLTLHRIYRIYRREL